jgi:hypothetical protein
MNFPIRPLAVLFAAGIAASPSAQAALLLRYTFDDAISPTADSGTGVPANGSVVGAGNFVTNTPSGIGSAYNTNSNGDSFISTTDPAKLDSLTSFTITLWVNLQATPDANDRLVSKLNATLTDGFDLRFNNTSGQLIFVVDNLSATSSQTLPVTTNVWQFVAVTYNGSLASANTNFYKGTLAAAVSTLGSTASINSGPSNDSAVDFEVGGTPASAAGRSPNAFFDDVRVYDQVLTPTELEAIRQSNIPEPTTALLAAFGLLLGARRRR